MGEGKSNTKVAAVDSTKNVNWHGMLKKHTFTDICCLFVFIAFLITWAVIGICAILQGDINKVTSF